MISKKCTLLMRNMYIGDKLLSSNQLDDNCVKKFFELFASPQRSRDPTVQCPFKLDDLRTLC